MRRPRKAVLQALAALVAMAALTLACRAPRAESRSPPPRVEAPADLVVTGVVHTMDDANPRAEAIAIHAGGIVHVGSRDSVRAFIGSRTATRDLGDGAVLPGFHDSHTHLAWSGTELQDVDLFAAKTLADLTAAIAARAAATPDEPWIRGGGWDPSTFEGTLHRSQLDGVATGRPVYMTSSDAHSAWVNTAALARAGITATTPDPDGGRIERDTRGEPTGILRESAMILVSKHLPLYSQRQVDAGLAHALNEAVANGITSIIDASAEPWMLDGYERAARRGTLTVRVHAAVPIDPAKGPEQLAAVAALRQRHAAPPVQITAIKLFVDGVIESRTAYMLAPYADGTNGAPQLSPAALADIAIAADRMGIQIHAHVIGDGAVRMTLDALDRVRAVNGRRDRRPILAHLQVVDPADLPRFGTHGVFAAFSPLWAHADPSITELTVPAIGPERTAWLYPMRAVEHAGGILAAGSDWSVSSMDPFDAMEVAVTRQAPTGAPGPALAPQHRVVLRAILAAYTINGARAAFADRVVGSLREGKRADFIIVDRDPFAVAPRDLSELHVLATFLDGREVYRAPARAAPAAGVLLTNP